MGNRTWVLPAPTSNFSWKKAKTPDKYTRPEVRSQQVLEKTLVALVFICIQQPAQVL